MYPDKQVLVRPRQAGKTTEALKWVFKGERCGGYPGWTRVLIVPSLQIEKNMRAMPCPTDIQEQVHNATAGKELPTSWWAALTDWSHRVYVLEEFRNGRFRPALETEFCVDDFDVCLGHEPELMGRVIRDLKITRIVMTGEEWSDE